MNTAGVKGTWKEQKGRLKQKFEVLTNNDLLFAEGQKEELFAKLQIKLGITERQLHKIMSGY